MLEQDWIFGFFGGLLIGLGGVVYLLFNGRILGASGVVGGLADATGWNTWAERSSFIAGLILIPYILTFLWVRPDTNLSDNWALLIFSGLLVGLGARIANGCTSGHGVCGISRLSTRGIGATVIYLFAGALTMLVARHFLGLV
jgi:uncharacterized protein